MKQSTLYRIVCEWDLGLEDAVFGSVESALLAAKERLPEVGIHGSFEELLDEGLVGTTPVYDQTAEDIRYILVDEFSEQWIIPESCLKHWLTHIKTGVKVVPEYAQLVDGPLTFTNPEIS